MLCFSSYISRRWVWTSSDMLSEREVLGSGEPVLG
jgi:hypothetical protein